MPRSAGPKQEEILFGHPYCKEIQTRIPIAAAVLAMSVSAVAMAQPGDSVRIQYRIGCSTCTLSLEPVATFGGAAVPILVGGIGQLERDSRGRYYAVSLDRFQVAVFDPNGRPITAVGRKGSGPGEFGANFGITRILIASDDSLVVFFANASFAVFSSDYRYVRGGRTGGGNPTGADLLEDGSWILASAISSRELVGSPFHIVRTDGVRVRSFGRYKTAAMERAPSLPFALSRNREYLWTVHHPYMLQKWSLSGNLIESLYLDRIPWMPQPARRDTMIAGKPVNIAAPISDQGTLAGIDSTGNLWINGSTIRRTTGGPEITWRIEIFDAATRTFLLSQQVPAALRFIPRSNLVFSITEDSDGILSYNVYRPQLVGLPSPR